MADFAVSADTSPDALTEWAASLTCPRCTNVGFRVETVLVAKPLGTFSLAGAQMKVSAVETPQITCGLTETDGCGASAVAHH